MPALSLSTSPRVKPAHPMTSSQVDKREWVLAAPFRAHVVHLVENAQVPWPIVAYQAGVPLATLRTLLFGRGGKARTKITKQAATRLLELHVDDLSWMRISQVSSERAGARIRRLRGLHITWDHICEFLHLDQGTCQAIARGEDTWCSVMVDILAQCACEVAGFDSWDDLGARS